MAGQIQMPSSYVRLTNSPLDISLTFDTLAEAKKYAAGTDNAKGTPYDGQIISVNNICSNNICGTFKLESSNSSPRIGEFRIVLLEIKRLDTGEIITPDNFIVYKDNNRYWLQVFNQLIKSNNGVFMSTMNSADILLSNKQYAYSIIALSDLFCNSSGKISYKAMSMDNSTGASTNLSSGEVGVLVSGVNTNISDINTYAFTINNNVLVSSGTQISYDGNNASSFSNIGGIEIYIDITDYLARNGVK